MCLHSLRHTHTHMHLSLCTNLAVQSVRRVCVCHAGNGARSGQGTRGHLHGQNLPRAEHCPSPAVWYIVINTTSDIPQHVDLHRAHDHEIIVNTTFWHPKEAQLLRGQFEKGLHTSGCPLEAAWTMRELGNPFQGSLDKNTSTHRPRA
jgi:hypothetical protein